MTHPDQKCNGCGKPATCQAKAGLGIFFVSKETGEAWHDPDRLVFHCDHCCAHSGEDGRCYCIETGMPMEDK